LAVEEEIASAIAALQPTDGDDYIDACARVNQLQLQVESIMKKTPTPCHDFSSSFLPLAGVFKFLLFIYICPRHLYVLVLPQDGHNPNL
jgi:hypothetical protein